MCSTISLVVPIFVKVRHQRTLQKWTIHRRLLPSLTRLGEYWHLPGVSWIGWKDMGLFINDVTQILTFLPPYPNSTLLCPKPYVLVSQKNSPSLRDVIYEWSPWNQACLQWSPSGQVLYFSLWWTWVVSHKVSQNHDCFRFCHQMSETQFTRQTN